uniref:Uncharacterized protein n=1 Tax=Apteryx owenii TaxID=8824 RepID=A0A8B9QI91_APTOW
MVPCSSSPQACSKLRSKYKPAKSSSSESLTVDNRLTLLSASLTFSSSPLWWYRLSASLFQRLTMEQTLSRYSATGRELPWGSSSVNTDSSSARLAKVFFSPSMRTTRRLVAAGGPVAETGSLLNLLGGCSPSALNVEAVLSSRSSLCFITSHHTSKKKLTSAGEVSLATYSTKRPSSPRRRSRGSARSIRLQ